MYPDIRFLAPIPREDYTSSEVLEKQYALLCEALEVERPSQFSSLNLAVIDAIAEILGPRTVSERWTLLGPTGLNFGREKFSINCDKSPEDVAVLIMRESSPIGRYPNSLMTMQLARLPDLVSELSNQYFRGEHGLDHDASVAEWNRIQEAYQSLLIQEK